MYAEIFAAQRKIAAIKTRIEQLKQTRPPRPAYSVSARDRPQPADSKLAIQGDPGNRGDVVPRGFLQCVEIAAAPPNPAESGRLELAEWIVHPDNPLTRRVIVNRIWRQLFGRGLVSTPDNFGNLGRTPSHPELLDWLASQFERDGWSIKQTIRRIMLSHVYQLASVRDPRGVQLDPDGVLLWRMNPRRLEAEAIRDAILAFSGRLDLSRPSGSPVTRLGDQLVRGVKLEQLVPASLHRSVYLPVVRDYPYKLFEMFDFPSPDLVNGDRATTIVPLQELYLRNAPEIAEHARYAADLIAREAGADDEARVELAFERALGRLPQPGERDAALALIRDIGSDPEPSQSSAAAGTEAVVADSVGDLAAGPTRQAALATLCRALISTAEFRYLVDAE